ncbi:hypothetical protein Barb6XT_00260 [Bacteroidales bacterium Barb6XT]|nr:hypothetical protein Barb6XT_00260 [Bacteroidales bacterium Barb6XT]
MPAIKKKSAENIKAARLLIKEELLASSVHCAYYSCLQLSKYFLNNYCGINYTQQYTESRGMGSHNYLIDSTSTQLIKDKRYLADIDYRKEIFRLRKLRTKSDYSEDPVTAKDAQDAYEAAERTIRILNTIINK